MELRQSQARDPRDVRGRSRRRFALPLVLLPVFAALSFAASGGGDDGTAHRTAGDGRGLATFGDRGITSFGDRFASGQSFSNRALTSFSDLPLTSMGGLTRGGAAAPADSGATHHHSRHGANDTGGFGFPAPATDFSQASLRVDAGDALATGDDDGVLLMPAVELPAVVFDHRPAAAFIDSMLDDAVRAASESGDLDLARSLDPDRR